MSDFITTGWIVQRKHGRGHGWYVTGKRHVPAKYGQPTIFLSGNKAISALRRHVTTQRGRVNYEVVQVDVVLREAVEVEDRRCFTCNHYVRTTKMDTCTRFPDHVEKVPSHTCGEWSAR